MRWPTLIYSYIFNETKDYHAQIGTDIYIHACDGRVDYPFLPLNKNYATAM